MSQLNIKTRIYKMLRTKEYIKTLNTMLPRGSRKNIALTLGVSESLVKMTLQGKRSNEEVLEVAENLILNQGVNFLPANEYIPFAYEIASKRTDTPFSYLKKEIFPWCFPGLNFSLN